MIVAAVVCPHPPLLLPEYAGGADPVAEPRAAVLAALGESIAEADEVVVVGGTDAYLAPADVGAGGEPLSIRVGRSLLARSGVRMPVAVEPIAFDAAPAAALELGAAVAGRPARTLLLVMADGSACHWDKGPGGLDVRAAPFDEVIANALREGDAATLRGVAVDLADELRAAGRAAWQVLAGALPQASGELHWTGAPYGVAYHVATWRPR